MEAEGAQCSPSFPAGTLLCVGFSMAGRLDALTISAADTSLAYIPLEERQTQLPSPGTNKPKVGSLEREVPVCRGTRPWRCVQPRLPGEGGTFQPCRAARTIPCPVVRGAVLGKPSSSPAGELGLLQVSMFWLEFVWWVLFFFLFLFFLYKVNS